MVNKYSCENEKPQALLLVVLVISGCIPCGDFIALWTLSIFFRIVIISFFFIFLLKKLAKSLFMLFDSYNTEELGKK